MLRSGPAEGVVRVELYVHIPFCVRKCRYCSFVSFTQNESGISEYIDLVLREAEDYKVLISEPFDTVYIGGGTPSLLTSVQIQRLIRGLRRILDLSGIREFTVEANPGTVSAEWLDTCLDNGINRISFGVQACQDELLGMLGRIHRFPDAVRSFETARICGFRNISADIMFGLPGQNMDQWEETLDAVISLRPDHISAYGLIPEDGTLLFEELNAGKLVLPDPEEERNMYDVAIRMLRDAGFLQYEISNFARPGYECVHNIGYWNQVPYLGLGISAASMLRKTEGCFSIRLKNPDSLIEYRRLVTKQQLPLRTAEMISEKEARFETVMLALRMNRGISGKRFMELHGVLPEDCYGAVMTRLEKENLLEHNGDCWKLTRRGMDIQNSILVEFMD